MIKPYVIQVTPENQEFMAQRAAQLSGDGGDGTSYGMDARVTRLETHMEYVRADLSEIKDAQKKTDSAINDLAAAVKNIPSLIEVSELKISNQLKDLPTKNELKNYNLQMIAIGIAILILVIGGVVGGLDYIKNH